MKNIRKILSFILSLMLLFSMAACASSGTSKYPSGYEEYASVLCLPIEEALPKLNLSENDKANWSMDKHQNSYTIGKKASFCGTDFDVTLWVTNADKAKEDYRFSQFQYTAFIEKDAKKSAELISAVAKKLKESYGETSFPNEYREGDSLADATLQELEQALAAEHWSCTNVWTIKELESQEALDLLKYANEYIGGNAADSIVFMVTMEVGGGSNADGGSYIRLTYGIEREFS